MLLYGKPVIEKLFQETVAWVTEHAPLDAYVALLLASNDYASGVYVTKKQKYAKRCGLGSELFNSPEATIDDVLKKIDQRNNDTACV